MSRLPEKWFRDVPSWVSAAVAVVLISLVLLMHLFWIDIHTALETWDDDAGLFRLAHCLYGSSVAGEACSAGAPYPPLVPALTAQHFQLVGRTGLHDALVSLWPFLVLLCGALFYGMRQVGGTMAGLAAAVLGADLMGLP